MLDLWIPLLAVADGFDALDDRAAAWARPPTLTMIPAE
jgi:hypothetical protein